MADHLIHLTDAEEAAFAAYLAKHQRQFAEGQRPFPPVAVIPDVDALILTFIEPERQFIRHWYAQAQAQEPHAPA